MEDNMEIWNKLKTPPEEALKKITGGRLSGMTDIKPQWRYEMMTEHFGMCGGGWKYEIVRQWTEEGTAGARFCFVNISLYVLLESDEWSEPIPGTGGSQLVTMEKNGLHDSDEGFKMATTDALSVAMKMLGMGSDVYMGTADGSKYNKPEGKASSPSQQIENPTSQEDREMLLKMYGKEGYSDGLEKLTENEKDGKFYKGIKSLADIKSAKQAGFIHGTIKKAFKGWEKVQEEKPHD